MITRTSYYEKESQKEAPWKDQIKTEEDLQTGQLPVVSWPPCDNKAPCRRPSSPAPLPLPSSEPHRERSVCHRKGHLWLDHRLITFHSCDAGREAGAAGWWDITISVDADLVPANGLTKSVSDVFSETCWVNYSTSVWICRVVRVLLVSPVLYFPVCMRSRLKSNLAFLRPKKYYFLQCQKQRLFLCKWLI